MDEHFDDLFARYEQLAPRHSVHVAGEEFVGADRAFELPLARPAAV